MDDSQGTMAVAPALYTIEFGRDGVVSMRLDCNRASGRWQAGPQGDGRSGSLAIGPLATTRASCTPPSIDGKVARDMAFVRSYILRDGRLHMALMADAAIYTWEPLTP